MPLAGSIAPFVVSSPFRGLRVVPCKLYFTEEKAIAAMTMDDILSMQGITVADITLINELQKSIKGNKVISFLGGGME